MFEAPRADEPPSAPPDLEMVQTWLDLAAADGRIGFWSIEPGRALMHCDAVARRLWGLDGAAVPVPLARLRERLAAPDREAFERALEGTGETLVELRCSVHADAAPPAAPAAPAPVRLRWRRGPMPAAADAPPRLLGTICADTGPASDTSVAKRRLELVTQQARVGYWSLERGGERPEWAPALRALHGVADDARTPTWSEWVQRHVHAADRELVEHSFADWLASDRTGLDLAFRILRRDGSERHVITHTRIEREAQPPVMYGIVVDVSERLAADSAWHRALERAQLAARGAGIGTWELELEGNSDSWDEQMWLLRGHPPQPRAMTRAERLSCVHPDDLAAAVARIDAAIASGEPLEQEFRIVRPDGQVRWLASRSIEVRDADGGTRRRIGVNWDVTDRRAAEEARRERELALRESQAKSKFLSRMSHELRTPLNAVLGFAQLLLAEEGSAGADPAQRRQRLEHIRTAGQQLLALTNDVLDLARVEGGEASITLQTVALAPLVAEALPRVQVPAALRRIELCAGALEQRVRADAPRLQQIVLHLLGNAVKYNRDGGRVHIDSRAEGPEVVLRVADTGRGLDPEQLQHLFEPFRRIEADADAIESTGIGLAIVRALVHSLHGSVDVRSRPGEGTVFEVRLANADSSGAQTAPLVTPKVPPRRRLLYIEDNAINATIISELVGRRSDLELVVAPTGASGVAQAHALAPELILLDMQLPDFDGFEVLRRLRADPATAGIAVIALSANAMPEDIRRALQAGMIDYWTKPLDFRGFMTRLEQFFGKPAGG